ncbi:MAG: hypothetical protein IJV69_03995 [Kiritimatiellae bacterium]|nr:hypothetical protein [Kiritimatiellia bacterium]
MKRCSLFTVLLSCGAAAHSRLATKSEPCERTRHAVRSWLFTVCCLLLAVCSHAAALPMQRVLDPSMMAPPIVADTVSSGGGLERGAPLTQSGIHFMLGSAMPHFTAVVWMYATAASYTQPFPFLAPEMVTTRAVGTTFLGPVTGTGAQTWTATVPGTDAYPTADIAAIAYNLTCSADCTIQAGSTSKTHSAGTHLGTMIAAAPGADITLTTTGDWTLEAAVPQYVRCYQPLVTLDGLVTFPLILGAQWGVIFCEGTLSDGQLHLTYRTYYPDGCPVIVDDTTGDTAITYHTPCDWTRFPRGLLCAPFAVTNLNTEVGDQFTAYGLKAWPRLLTESERLFIVRRDRERMLAQGHLTDADLLHDGTATYSLRAPLKIHSPGETPPQPTLSTSQ